MRANALARYPRCSPEQALVYAVEDEVDAVLGIRVVAESELGDVLSSLCDAEDIDEPVLSHVPRRSASPDEGSVDLETREMRLRSGPLALSVIVHETAHLVSAAGNHGREFRDELVRLTRTHVSVEHGAMMHSLFRAVGLDVADWRV